jgi:TRAP-type C4-dicarboxylate transport system permease small subunit
MSSNIGTNIKRITDISQKAISLLLGLILASFMTIIFLQTLGRYLNFSIWWSEEISRYLFIWLIMLGVNVATYQKDMLRLEILDMILSEKAKLVTNLIVDIISLAAVSALFYCSVLYIKDLGSNQIAPTLGIQMRYVVSCIPIGMALSIWTQVLVILNRISELFIKTNDKKEGLTDAR